MTLNQFLIAVIPLIGWGLGDIFGVIASRKIGSYLTTFYQFLFGIIITSLILPLVWESVYQITPTLLLINISLGCFYVLANFFVNEGFKQASAPIVGIIIQSFPAMVILLSTIIFKDPITLQQIFWIALVFIGVTLCSIEVGDLIKSKHKFDVGIKYAIAATIIFSVYFTCFRIFSSQYGWFLPNYISFLTLPLALFLARKIIKEKSVLSIPKNFKILGAALISAVLIRSGDVALNLGVSQGLASLVSPIAGAAPIVFVLASAIVFKDRITKQQIFGVFLALFGITALSVFS